MNRINNLYERVVLKELVGKEKIQSIIKEEMEKLQEVIQKKAEKLGYKDAVKTKVEPEKNGYKVVIEFTPKNDEQFTKALQDQSITVKKYFGSNPYIVPEVEFMQKLGNGSDATAEIYYTIFGQVKKEIVTPKNIIGVIRNIGKYQQLYYR